MKKSRLPLQSSRLPPVTTAVKAVHLTFLPPTSPLPHITSLSRLSEEEANQMGEDSKEARAAKRAAKLKAVEAAKPEHERLLNKEWNDQVVKATSVLHLRDIG